MFSNRRRYLEMTNRLTPEAINGTPVRELEKCFVGDLVDGAERVEAAQCDLDNAREKLQDVLCEKYREQIAEAQKLLGGKAGAVRTVDNGYAVIIRFPEVIEWNQEKLMTLVHAPQKCMTIHCTVTEEAYKQCDPVIRVILDKARTVKVGEPVVIVEPLLTVEDPGPCTVLGEEGR